jgi:hypothetical protein
VLKMGFAKSAFVILFVTATVGYSSALDYFVSGPKTIRPNSSIPISILCQNASSDVNVNISLISDQKVVYSTQKSIQAGKLDIVYLPINNLTNTATYRLKVRGTDSTDFFDNAADLTLQNDVLVKKTHILIQTDQPLYQAKNTVKFRVLTVDEQLLPVYLPLQVRVKVKIINKLRFI